MTSPHAFFLRSSSSIGFNYTKLAFFLFVVLNCSKLFGQVVNIEQARIHLDTTGWAGIAHANFQAQKYNNLLFSSSLRGSVQHRIDKRIWLYLVDGGFSVADQVQFNNNALAHVRYNYLLSDFLQWETFTQLQQNRLLGLDRRYLTGTGMRMIISETDRAKIYFGLMGMLELERAKPSPRTFAYGRTSTYLSFTWKEVGKWAVSSTMYFQPLMDNIKDYRFSGQHAFAFALNEQWSFRLEITHFYDSRPPQDFVEGNFSSTFGIAYDFGKRRG
ncbi:MAG: DUF481 domain-containing protein [Flavobacteriales bacterium]